MTVAELDKKANQLRQDVIEMLVEAGSGHTAGPLGLADIFSALYFRIMNHDPKNPDWNERDMLILSNGHTVPIRYAAMARAGYFPVKELKTLRKFGSRLQGHPERVRLPGLETTSGPLGSGVSAACGMALTLKMDGNQHRRVYCITGDGELDEGNIWEAIMFGAKYKLNNLTVIVDRNNIQIDGHNIQAIIDACNMAKAIEDSPVVIIAHTIPGKGVDFMEYDYHWHGIPPGIQDLPGDPEKAKQAKVALHELRTLGGRIRGEHE